MSTNTKMAEAQPLKERPDFMAGYVAGLADGRRCAERDSAEQAAKAVPAGFVLVPLDLLRDAAESIDDYRAGVDFGSYDRKLIGRLKAAMLAAAPTPPAPEAQQAAGQEPYTSDRHLALREAHCIGDGEKFWKARPGTNKDNGRAIAFDDGYVRGFDKGTELADARAAVSAANSLAQRREPLTDGQLSALLKEARKIIRASSSRSLAKDWDRRATQALAGATTGSA